MTSLKNNFKTMFKGTLLSQLIPIAFTPVLTRIFTPDDFGLFAFYLSIVTIICAFNSGKYEQSLPLVKNQEQADSLTIATFIVIGVITIFLYIPIYLISLFSFESLNKLGNLIWFLPISAGLMSIYQTLTYWHNRKSNFYRISKNLYIQSLVNVLSSLFMGLMNFKTGLIFGDLFAKLYSSLNLFEVFRKTNWQIIKENYSRYSDSPKFLVPATLLNSSAKQLPIIIFGLLFLPKVIGYLLIAQRVFQGPIGIVSTSLSQALLNKMSVEFKETGNCIHTYNKSLLFLALIPLPAALIIYLFIESLVVTFFGKNWIELSLLIKILLPFYYIYFISGTLNIVLIATGKKKINLLMQTIYFVFTVILIGLCYIFKFNSTQAILAYSITSSLSFLISLCISYKISKGIKNAK